MSTTVRPFSTERLLAALQDLPESPRWWVAFSGGADSTALLHALWRLRGRLTPDIQAMHVDHGLHADSAHWRSRCEKFCLARGIPLHYRRISVPRRSGLSIEAEARQQRYAAAERLLGPREMLLTAHHADDQAETLLLNLMRGSGPDGLAGMPRVRPLGQGLLARPLLDFSGASLRDYLQSEGVDWIEDSSNLDESYDRNFVRAKLIPLLEQRWPGARRNLATSARFCREASEFIGAAAQRAIEPCMPIHPVLELACLPEGDPRRHGDGSTKLMVRQWLRLNQAPPLPARRLEELLRQVAGADAGQQVAVRWEGWVMRLYRERVWLQREDQLQDCPTVGWDTSRPLDLGPVLGTLSLEGRGRLPAPLLVRPRQPGDRIECLPGGHSRPVKQLLRESGIPPWLRESVPLLLERGEVVAIAGHCSSNRLSGLLQDQGLRLLWRPGDPILQWLIGPPRSTEVDRQNPLG